MSKVYRMKPLEWRKEHDAVWRAKILEYEYQVYESEGYIPCQVAMDHEYEYRTFDSANSIAHGKQLAEDHWQKRWLETAVEVVPDSV